MTEQFNPSMLVLAREARGMTQSDLAGKAGLTQSTLSKYENGMLSPAESHVERLAGTLQYPVSLFAREDRLVGAGACLYHRKQASMPLRHLRRIEAEVCLDRMQVSRLMLGAEAEFPNTIPQFDIADYDFDAERVASLVRTAWRLPLGPIRNLVGEIEKAGGVVVFSDFGTRKLCAISSPIAPAVFVVNSSMPWDRIRHTIAHELGHQVMHSTPTEDQEAEADRFAAEFLMPRTEIERELSGLTLAGAARLKPYWRVSMASLIRRAHDLGCLSDWQYRELMKEMGWRKYRLLEPVSLGAEVPTLRDSLVRLHFDELGYTVSELSSLVDLLEDEFRVKYLGETPPMRVVK